MKRIRLMNVAQVLIYPAQDLMIEHRPAMVEITQDPLTKAVLLVMYAVTPSSLIEANGAPVEPALSARIHHKGRAVILDPIRWGWEDGDLRSWRVYLRSDEGPDVPIYIKPAIGESIWIDHSFARDDLSSDQKALHAAKRAAMLSLTVNSRLIQETKSEIAKDAYRANVLCIEARLRKIDELLHRSE